MHWKGGGVAAASCTHLPPGFIAVMAAPWRESSPVTAFLLLCSGYETVPCNSGKNIDCGLGEGH